MESPEYDIRSINFTRGENLDFALRAIKRLCEEMGKSGWTLSTMAWPHETLVVLAFTRRPKEHRPMVQTYPDGSPRAAAVPAVGHCEADQPEQRG